MPGGGITNPSTGAGACPQDLCIITENNNSFIEKCELDLENFFFKQT